MVIDLQKVREERQPHSTGTAICLDCRHEWEAVAPDNVLWLECPSCKLVRGRFKYQHEIAEGLEWRCNCGNDLFRVTPDGYYCPNCGEWQTGF